MQQRKQILVLISLFVVAMLWGVSFILIKKSVTVVGVSYFNFLRFAVSFLILAFLFPKKIIRVKKKDLVAAAVLGTFLVGCYFSQTQGLKFTSASNSALITGLYLIFIPLFLTLFSGFRAKTVNLFSVLGVLVAFVGLYFLTQYSFTGMNQGDWITLVCAASCAGHFILTGRFTHQHDLVTLVLFQCLFVSLVSGAAAVAQKQVVFLLPPVVILSVGVTAVFCTVLALLVQTVAQRVMDPTRTGVIASLESVFGALFACLWGGERLTPLSIFGAVLMLLGMLISESQFFLKKKKVLGCF